MKNLLLVKNIRLCNQEFESWNSLLKSHEIDGKRVCLAFSTASEEAYRDKSKNGGCVSNGFVLVVSLLEIDTAPLSFKGQVYSIHIPVHISINIPLGRNAQAYANATSLCLFHTYGLNMLCTGLGTEPMFTTLFLWENTFQVPNSLQTFIITVPQWN